MLLDEVGLHNKCNQNKLVWNVVMININTDNVEVENLLEKGCYLWDRVKEILKKNKDISFEEFEDKVDRSLMHMYWSRYEYEHVITTFPPHLTIEGLEKANKEREDKIKDYGSCRFVQAPLEVGEKVDVYFQVQLNWTAFITYLWNNKEKIYKPRKSKSDN